MMTDPPPLVSIIMPTYRRLQYIRIAIESALDQTFRDFELILSDNDRSVEVRTLVASYGDLRVRYRHNGSNIGAMRNAHSAYLEARGTYVTTLHDDDAWEPGFLEALVPRLEADSGLTLAFCDHYLMDTAGTIDIDKTNDNSRLWRRHTLSEGVVRPFQHTALVDRAVPVVMGSVIRKSAIDWYDFPAEVGAAYDLWLAYLASRDGGGAYYTSARLTRYRQHAESMTAAARLDVPLIYCHKRFLADDRLRLIRPGLRRELAAARAGRGMTLVRSGAADAGRCELLKALPWGSRGRAAAGLAYSLLPDRAATIVTDQVERRRRASRDAVIR